MKLHKGTDLSRKALTFGCGACCLCFDVFMFAIFGFSRYCNFLLIDNSTFYFLRLIAYAISHVKW